MLEKLKRKATAAAFDVAAKAGYAAADAVDASRRRRRRAVATADPVKASDPLVWKDEDAGTSLATSEAPAARGIYSICPSQPMTMTGRVGATYFTVLHMPHGTITGERRINNARTMDAAKAIAQADHDAGNDR